MLCRHLAMSSLALVLIAGCSLSSPSSAEERADAAPIRVKTPGGDDKSGTSPSCGGITEHGVCEDGAAVVCDVAAGELRRTDCEALGQRCIVDSAEGATCQDAGAASCDSGLDFRGVCEGDVARWCDAEGDKSWNCAADGLTCATDECEEGAFCCDANGGGGDEAPPECEELGFFGECGGDEGQTARYCNGGALIELDCGGDPTTSCQVDSCADGAYCCPGESECADLGLEGACAGDTLRYCREGDDYQEVACGDFGMTCGVDACGDGADCCDLRCEDIPQEGTCIGDWLIFCELGELRKVNCPEDEPGTSTCTTEGQFAFAECV